MVAIFVALMFVGFVLADLVVQKWEAGRRAQVSAVVATRESSWVGIPDGVYLAEGHAWAELRRGGIVRAGVDSLIGRTLGSVSRVLLPQIGKAVTAGQPLFALESRGRVLKIVSPASGKVVAVNLALQARPELLTDDAFGKGWVCAISPDRPLLENGFLRSGTKARAWFEGEVERLQNFFSMRLAPDAALGLTAQDGGLPARGALADFDRDTWNAFVREFLRPGRKS